MSVRVATLRLSRMVGSRGGDLGAKTGLLVYADGDAPALLEGAGAADHERTVTLMRRLYPGWDIGECAGSTLDDGVYPMNGTAYAGSWPGVEIVCDRRATIDLPSGLPERLVRASSGRRLVLHVMHSVSDWLAFAVWEDGRLVRSLSVSPDAGIMENLGEPLSFERPYWDGERPSGVVPVAGGAGEPYPLPFHPLDFGEDALRARPGGSPRARRHRSGHHRALRVPPARSARTWSCGAGGADPGGGRHGAAAPLHTRSRWLTGRVR